MANPPCTELSQAEEAELMKAFPAWLSDSEEETARKFFQPLVFFRAEGSGVRRCVCTSCMEGFFAHKEMSPGFFRATHGKRCECPNCGQAATLAAMGKFGNFSSLTSHERAVQISVHGDWLLIQSGWLWRTFSNDDLVGELEFDPYRRYAFAPGRRMMWQRNMISTKFFGDVKYLFWDGPWERQKSIRKPFPRQSYEPEASYIPMGAENLRRGPMRYNGFSSWFAAEFGGDLGGEDWLCSPFRVAYLIAYLAEYTRYPQIELLTKLGYHQVVSDMFIRGKPHKDILDWTAKNPANFFRLSRNDFRLFKNGVGTFSGLKLFRQAQKAGLIRDLEEFEVQRKECGTDFDLVCRSCILSGVKLERGVRYLQRFDGVDGLSLREAPQYWLDYLTAAKKLRYDLKRDDVRMPKDLRQRHDEAAAAARIKEDKALRKKAEARYGQLVRQFAFESDGLCILVPLSVQEIVDEGRVLRHCVGGYAERHMRGAATILFLRKAKNPAAPYVTMELSTENNCEKLHIVQIHGFKNDIGKKITPEEKHKDFLREWLDWVHAGSPRDAEGKPVVQRPAADTQASA